MSLICESGLGWCTFRNWTWQFGRLIALWPAHHIRGNCRRMQKPNVQCLAAALPPDPSHNSERGHGLPGTRNTIKVSKLREFHFSTGLLQKKTNKTNKRTSISEHWGKNSAFCFCLNSSVQTRFKSWPLMFSVSRQVHLSQHTSLTHCTGNFFFVVICKEHTIS